MYAEPGGRLHGQHRLSAIQRLDMGLLVDTQHDRVLRWGQIESPGVGHFGHQFGVGGELKSLGPHGCTP